MSGSPPAALAACLFGAPASTPAPELAPPPTISTPYRVRAKVRHDQFNFVLEGGGGGRFAPDDFGGAGFGRLTFGGAHLLDRTFFAEGVFYEISNVSYATFGFHFNVMFPSRLYFDFGPSIDIEVRPGVHAGVGWGILGVEAQYRQYLDGTPTFMVMAKLTAVYFILSHSARPPKKGGRIWERK